MTVPWATYTQCVFGTDLYFVRVSLRLKVSPKTRTEVSCCFWWCHFPVIGNQLVDQFWSPNFTRVKKGAAYSPIIYVVVVMTVVCVFGCNVLLYRRVVVHTSGSHQIAVNPVVQQIWLLTHNLLLYFRCVFIIFLGKFCWDFFLFDKPLKQLTSCVLIFCAHFIEDVNLLCKTLLSCSFPASNNQQVVPNMYRSIVCFTVNKNNQHVLAFVWSHDIIFVTYNKDTCSTKCAVQQ